MTGPKLYDRSQGTPWPQFLAGSRLLPQRPYLSALALAGMLLTWHAPARPTL